MPQYVLPRSMRPRIPEMVSESGAIAIQPMDIGPLTANGARWWRFTCNAGSARAFCCLGEHPERPDDIVITVSIDLRRLPMLWRVPGDWLLVRRMAETLEREGARVLTDDD